MRKRWLSAEDIAVHLGLNMDPISYWITCKKVTAHKFGRLWSILASEVDLWIKGGHAAEDNTTDTAPADPHHRTFIPGHLL